ncbi:MAG: UDP-N-acetylmuramate--L-alanine ligase [Clostridia bacterium]|nr:UDP-N-acetylmuramate--L-alanine ligase [Clostridia bacterium]
MRIHFIGILGVGMSALALHSAELGNDVSGSDRSCSRNPSSTPSDVREIRHLLEQSGVKLNCGHRRKHVCGADLVVVSAAIPACNCELAEAKRSGIPILSREELLGRYFNAFDCPIAISGTHGKTTTTAMVYHILKSLGYSPACFVGGLLNGRNYVGGTNVAVAEACEYKSAFLRLFPKIGVILNVEYDHVDFYKTRQSMLDAYGRFISNIDGEGVAVYCNQAPELCELVKANAACKTASFAVLGNEVGPNDKENNLSPTNEDNKDKSVKDDAFRMTVRVRSVAPLVFDVEADGQCERVNMRVFGRHNAYNAAAALCAACCIGADLAASARTLESFESVYRRFSRIEKNGLNVVLDYAHHPTELSAAISTARAMTSGKLLAVFQPHTYTRTKAFLTEFAASLNLADSVILLPVYAAREKPVLGGMSSDLLAELQKLSTSPYADTDCTRYFLAESFDECIKQIKQTARNGDTVIVLGAGDIEKLVNLL